MIAKNPANRIHAKAGCSDLSTNGNIPTVPGHTLIRLARTGHQAEMERSFHRGSIFEINDIRLAFPVGGSTLIRDDGDKNFFLVLRHD